MHKECHNGYTASRDIKENKINESTEVHNPRRDVVKYSMSLASRIRYQWYVLYCMGL